MQSPGLRYANASTTFSAFSYKLHTFQPLGNAHAWIEAVCLCVSAMLPHNQHMVFKTMRDDCSSDDSDMSTLSRFVDHIAIVADHDARLPGNSTLT